MSPTTETSTETTDAGEEKTTDFIRTIVGADVEGGKHGGRVMTRFPPEPNGYIHIGHAKAMCLDFGIAEEFGGVCNLRFEDTNPEKESMEFVESIETDVRWLGFNWSDREYFASDYYEKLFDFAVILIEKGVAYVDSLSGDEIREHRGTLTQPGIESPHRDRSVRENLDLFRRMRAGEFTDGEYVLRAKIDMASPNMNMRDPTLYRIRHQAHYRRGDEWCIYPMYDFTECLCDEIEGVTHSLCDIGYENHRPLYDWILRQVGSEDPPHQYEFARLNITYTVLSKRHLLRLVSEGHVSGWDDPRMPTISGLRRRGYTPEAIKAFIREVGVAKRENLVEIGLLEYHIREDLNKHARRVLGVLDPVKLIIDNYPEGQVEELEGINNPEDESAGTRMLPFTRELYIERDDFREEAPKKYHRLAPGKEVRLRYGYYVTCVDYEKDPESGEISEIHCTYDPETRGGSAPDGRKVRGTIHWVSAPTAVDAEVRLYDRLFTVEAPDPSAADLVELLNPDSRRVLTGCKVEPSLAGAESGSRYQFERQGYFCVDDDSTVGGLVFNRTVALRDSWSKIEKSQGKQV